MEMLAVCELPLRPSSAVGSCCSEASFRSFLSLPEEILIADKRYRDDSEVSPGSQPDSGYPRTNKPLPNMSAIAPWETGDSPTMDRLRQTSVGSSGGSNRVPQIQRQPPTTVSPSPHYPLRNASGNPVTPNGLFSSFYDDSSEEMAQLSPAFRPGSSQEDMGYPENDRRPSVASATTISSIGSKSSARGPNYHKKLGNFFGDDFPGLEAVSRQNSESSLPPNAILQYAGGNNSSNNLNPRARKNSANNVPHISRPVSPASFAGRPKTPHASEVTPWEFQEGGKDLPPPPPPPHSTDRDRASLSKATRTHNHRLHFPGHKHTRSKDEPTNNATPGLALRPSLSRQESNASFGRAELSHSSNASNPNLKANLTPRPPSPTPSFASINTMSQRSGHHKRGLFDKYLRRRDKHGFIDNIPATMPGSTTSLTARNGKTQKLETLPTAPGKKFSFAGDALPPVPGPATKDGRIRPFLKSKKTAVSINEFGPPTRDGNDPNLARGQGNAKNQLNMDFGDLSDYVSSKPQAPEPVDAGIFTGLEPETQNHTVIPPAREEPMEDGKWAAPDSWGVVATVDDNMARLREFDENGNSLEEDSGPPYCLRIFRGNDTFAVLSVPLNTTVADIIELIRKKTYTPTDPTKLENFVIVMKKHDVSRQLEGNERPLVIQKRLLEQAGYVEADRIEDVGREDNSYLCRFTFLPQKEAGFTTLDKVLPIDEKTTGKYSHVDLQGKNLITIPVVLHKNATDIVSLNLSRNLAMSIPNDFIQACVNLREIKFCSNECWKIPPSFTHATRLTMLDLSTNRIEQLEHTELNRLSHLASLRIANNNLTTLPRYFGQYKFMRSLNISSNGFTSFPDVIQDITSLIDLDISFNLMSKLPNLGNLTSLERLWATNNRFTGSFHPSTANLINLREVDIRHNALEDIDIFCKMPKLEYLLVGYNNISTFEGSFHALRGLSLNSNPVTKFDITSPLPSLGNLRLERAKLSALPDDLFQKIPNLNKLALDKNHFVSLSPNIGKLVHLEYLTLAQNSLSSLPPEIGRLVELKYLDMRENNLNVLPPQIWFLRKLETLNLSSNVLGSFPKPGAPLPALPEDTVYNSVESKEEELGTLGHLQYRRPSAATTGSGSLSSSPGAQSRKGSVASQLTASRKPSFVSRGSDATTTTLNTLAPITRKDSSLSNRLMSTFAGSMRYLNLADNRLQDEVFDEIALLPELRVLNLSYNILYDLPPRTLRRWTHLDELYLSGNELRSLPAEDLDEINSLRVLHINCNKFQVLPAELAKVSKLAIMDVGSNALKYNVSNWPYDWNWNWNHQLKYLNMSGNTRLEIKPGTNKQTPRGDKDLTDFSSLQKLRILGLMDVTLRSQVPDQSEDRRVRTAGSQVGSMSYGMADSLGKNEHLSILDMVVDRFRSHDDEVLLGLFDAPASSMGGSKIAKYLHEHFKHRFSDELEKLKNPEIAADALRRTFLNLNKELAIIMNQHKERERKKQLAAENPSVLSTTEAPIVPAIELSDEDLLSGCVGTVLFIKEMQLFVANVGDATALLVDSEGNHRVITRKHDPTEPDERARIRVAGGYVSRQGKLNDVLGVSRAFGYIQHSPSMIAAPHTAHIQITDSHEMIILASQELWHYMSHDFAVDMARTERRDLMRAAQKLRDLAIAFGASSKLMIMIIGVSDLKKKEALQVRTHSMSMSPSGLADDFFPRSRGRRDKNAPFDSRLARLDQEVDPPQGQVSLVFTDIKNSTFLWETYPIAMRSAIRMHNELMRRQLRIIGGYEVKTEGDAFIVSFPTVTSALLWAFTMQIQLLEVPWPTEILNSVNGQEVSDQDGNVIFRGLSVRMGIHWGQPVCEVDPVTKRMDYFGPMVNRSARISSVADGGQITVSTEFISEIQRLLETHVDEDRSGSMDSGEDPSFVDDALAQQIKRELRSLSSQGFEVKELGEKRLKGLENPEYIYLMYPHALSSRLLVQQQRAEAEAARSLAGQGLKPQDSSLAVDVDNVWDLCAVALRLETLCSSLENPRGSGLKPPETAFLERIKEGGGEITDRFLLNIVEHQVSRIETCINTLALRNLVRPFKNGVQAQACPISDIFAELANSLSELNTLRENAQNRITEL
ncbi:PP2C-domain-containing protein [Microthyrium microscopicum]|uniref:Adenylate cyclase n=1 Tax=Microthyrium microscopicum TaxID=703497 RepID=A0A6A6UGL8_9PEZI|nr:PP2C-domain-containing protein [Microthyrium microscopicum]